MSTKKSRPAKVAGAKNRLIAQREAEARAKAQARRRTAVTLIVIVALLVAGAGLYGWYSTHKTPVADATSNPLATASDSSAPDASSSASAAATDKAYLPVTITDGKGITIGLTGAPNVITVYSDFACSHCHDFEKAYGQTLGTIVQAGGTSIDYWPLGSLSEGSARASNAMACAAERQPQFGVAMYNGIFGNYGLDWSNDQLISLATQLSNGNLPQGFETCVTSGAHAAWVKSILAVAKAGPAANGTPAVYVNGKPFDLTTGTVDSLTAMLS